MKYPLEKRLDIGREVYEHELTAKEAAIKYDLNIYTIRDYKKLYLSSKISCSDDHSNESSKPLIIKNTTINLERLKSMSNDELIDEVIKSKIQIERLKKNYEIQEYGTPVTYVRKNTR